MPVQRQGVDDHLPPRWLLKSKMLPWVALSPFFVGLFGGCGEEVARNGTELQTPAVSSTPTVPVFDDVAREVGLDFVHHSGATGQYYMPEVVGSGVALFDYDGDNDLDVLFMQGKALDDAGRLDLARRAVTPGHRLFRNNLNPSGTLSFSDVTQEAGIGIVAYGTGVSAGDIDNDGDQDLYLTHFGNNALLRNDGDGRFTDITAASGTNDDRFSTSSAFLDYDADGLLDLFVANYNAFVVGGNKRCRNRRLARDYCGPLDYPAVADALFRNNGDGSWSNVSRPTGIDQHPGSGLGVVGADLDADGALDIYVANDEMPNTHWVSDGRGGFTNASLMRGTAYNIDGVAESSMGLLAGDIDGDGDDDLFITHLSAQTNTLYLNDGSGNFVDSTDRLGLGVSSLPYTGFGAVWIDYDNDGDHDILIANGLVRRNSETDAGALVGYEQKNQLYRNDNGRRFEDVSGIAGPSFQVARNSRGAAVGDLDNDGDLDVIVTNTDGPPQMLVNRTQTANRWLGVRLRGTQTNRDGVGARVAVVHSNGDIIWRRAHSDGSYLSASDIRVHFGLGPIESIRGVVVVWPGGHREIWTNPALDRQLELVEREGRPWAGAGEKIKE